MIFFLICDSACDIKGSCSQMIFRSASCLIVVDQFDKHFTQFCVIGTLKMENRSLLLLSFIVLLLSALIFCDDQMCFDIDDTSTGEWSKTFMTVGMLHDLTKIKKLISTKNNLFCLVL